MSDVTVSSAVDSFMLSADAVRMSEALPELNGGAGIPTMIPPLAVYELLNNTTQDTTYQTLDLSAYVPPGAVHVILEFALFTSAAPLDATIVWSWRAIGDMLGGYGGSIHDGSSDITPALAAYNTKIVSVRVGSDRKIQYKRANPNARACWYRLALRGWSGSYSMPTVGAAGVLVPYNGTTNYPSYPFGVVATSGTRLLSYRDWDGTNAAAHATGGAAWLMRNEGAAVQLWSATGANGSTATPDAEQVQDTFVLQQPGTSTLVFLIRTYGSADHFYATSADDGVTWGSMTIIPTITGLPVGWVVGDSGFFDFIPSSNGAKLYASFMTTESGQAATNQSVALLESTDGFTWGFKSWIASYTTQAIGANETGLIRMPTGRIVAVMRKSSGNANGYTAYSDDDGVTWTTPVQQTGALWQGMRGVAIGATRCIVFGRNYDGVEGFPMSIWVLDSGGTKLWGPVGYFQNVNPSHGGYGCLMNEPSGRYIYHYEDLRSMNGAGPNLCKTPFLLRYQ